MNRVVLVGGAFVGAMILAWVLFTYVLRNTVDPLQPVSNTAGTQPILQTNTNVQPLTQTPAASTAAVAPSQPEPGKPDIVFNLLAIAPVTGTEEFGITLRVNDGEHAFYRVGEKIAGVEATLESAELQRAVIDHDGKKVVLDLPIPVRPKSPRALTEDESILSLPSRQGFDAF